MAASPTITSNTAQSSAATHALQSHAAKSHDKNRAGQNDSFADMLAQNDPALSKPDSKAPAPRRETTRRDDSDRNETRAADDKDADARDVNASDAGAAASQTATARPKSGKDEDVLPGAAKPAQDETVPVNDNDAAMAALVPAIAPQAAQTAAQAQAKDDDGKAVNAAADAPQGVAAPAAQPGDAQAPAPTDTRHAATAKDFKDALDAVKSGKDADKTAHGDAAQDTAQPAPAQPRDAQITAPTLAQAPQSPVADKPVAPPALATPQPQPAHAHAAPDVNGLAVDIAARSQSGAKQFDIRLDPPELGRVEVRLSIDATGKAQAHLTADQPQTLDLLQKDATNLTRALRDAGLDVSQDGLNFSLRNPHQQSGGDDGRSAPQQRSHFVTAARTTETTAPAPHPYGGAGLSLLDIRV